MEDYTEKSYTDLIELRDRCKLSIKNLKKIIKDNIVTDTNFTKAENLLNKYEKILNDTEIELEKRISKNDNNSSTRV